MLESMDRQNPFMAVLVVFSEAAASPLHALKHHRQAADFASCETYCLLHQLPL